MSETLSSNLVADTPETQEAIARNLRSVAIDLRAEGREIDAACCDGGSDVIDSLTAEVALWKANTERMSRYFEETAHERDRLRAALKRAHDVIRKCVTAGVLRHDLNQFLADEEEYRGPPHEDLRAKLWLCENPNPGGGYCPDCGQVHTRIKWPERPADETTPQHTVTGD